MYIYIDNLDINKTVVKEIEPVFYFSHLCPCGRVSHV